MIQEKDFLYRVPVKTAPITTPRGQIRNPEILVDLEGGEFMHGNILDANSTNKLVNQSVKEQENSLKTLIDAETSARTKGDEDLNSKIKAEQTRAEGKEKEISDKLAIVNGDSNTEGSFRKAIADVVAAAPEDLDTLKEIADKLAGNDDLHTALNQAITEKADASALANEVARATGVESGLQAAIATKADATALSNYVLTTALDKQVDTLNAAISGKQDAGNYIPYKNIAFKNKYVIEPSYSIEFRTDALDNKYGKAFIGPQTISITSDSGQHAAVEPEEISVRQSGNASGTIHSTLNADSFGVYNNYDDSVIFKLNQYGIKLEDGDNNHVLTSNASTIDITQYVLKSVYDEKIAALEARIAALEAKHAEAAA